MFAIFWNAVARITGKGKIRTEREAQNFLRDLAKNSGGPNEKIIAMRREYESAKEASNSQNQRNSTS